MTGALDAALRAAAPRPATSVSCPYCGAHPEQPCFAPSGEFRDAPHRPRVRRAALPARCCRYCLAAFDSLETGTRLYCCAEHAVANRRHTRANRDARAATFRPRRRRRAAA